VRSLPVCLSVCLPAAARPEAQGWAKPSRQVTRHLSDAAVVSLAAVRTRTAPFQQRNSVSQSWNSSPFAQLEKPG